jgi:hypothetical protein
MKEKIKKISLLIALFLFFSLVPILNTEARQGCCSHHGGVCGCRCCDGTPLSAKCAPYYPQCSTPKPIQTQLATPQPIKPIVEVQNENNDSGSVWPWITGTGIVSYIFYRFIKRKKNINP